MKLDPPLYPDREVYHSGEVPEALRVLEDWVRGRRPFHRYGQWPHEVEGYDRALRARLDLRGELVAGGMRWTCSYRRVGLADEHGFSSGYSHPADAAYACLVHIEQHEREVYEENLVVGIA